MPIIESLIGPIASIIDKVIPDKAARDKAKLDLLELQGTQEMQQIQTQLSAIVAEANSRDPWTSRVRPSFLYVMILWALPMGVLSAFRPDTARDIANAATVRPRVSARERRDVDRGQLAHRAPEASALLGMLAEVLPGRVSKRAPVPRRLGALAQLCLELRVPPEVGWRRDIGRPRGDRTRVIRAQRRADPREPHTTLAVEAHQTRGGRGSQHTDRHASLELKLAGQHARIPCTLAERIREPRGDEHSREHRALHPRYQVPQRALRGQHQIGDIQYAPAQSKPSAHKRKWDGKRGQRQAGASLPRTLSAPVQTPAGVAASQANSSSVADPDS